MAAVVGSFSLRLFCASACATHHAARTAVHCHEVDESARTVETTVDCGQHDALPALTEGRRIIASPDLVALPALTHTFALPLRVAFAAAETVVDTGPPPLVRTLPLRI